jgi:hypothetical protein
VERAAEKVENETERAADEVEEEAEEVERDAERAAEKAERETDDEGNAIREGAANVGAHIKDKVYEGKGGPHGQTVYIDKHSKYYFIGEDGKKVFLTKAQMTRKKKD